MGDLTQRYYDLIIIGGGINGAAVARDAALRGLKVCLFEKNAFGSGTSSKSSKLAHGGLRYLEQYEFRMVQETLYERDLLLKLAPKYVKPLPFIYPVYQFSNRSLFKVKLGMWVYHFLNRTLGVPKYQMLNTEQLSDFCPSLVQKQLKGGALYYDAQLQDKELVLANIRDAKQAGAEAYEEAKVIGFIKDKKQLKGVKVELKGAIHEIEAKHVLNASGPWLNELVHLDNPKLKPIIAPTKGVHLVVKNVALNYALILESHIDKRIFFIIPWHEHTLIGTTDTPYDGDADDVGVDEADIQYLLDSANRYLSQNQIKKEDIIEQFAGLRPLRYSEKGASARSRDFSITQSQSGLINLFGGKYTSYRLMAEETVDYIVSLYPDAERFNDCSTHKRYLE